jgi:hypothetical protein
MDILDEMKENKRSDFKSDDNIGKLRSRMYSRERKGFLPWRRRRDGDAEQPVVQDHWDYAEPEKRERTTSPEVKHTGMSALLIFSIIFFVLAGVSAFVYLRMAATAATASEVDIAIEGPSSVTAGDMLELQVLVTNRNDASLELADLIVTYPDGSVSPADFRTPLSIERIPMGLIEARSARRGAVRGVMLGSNGDVRNISIELQYRVAGTSVIQSRKAQHTALITTDAMSISVEGDAEVTPGQNTPITITVKSHATTLLNDVYLALALPFGFTIVDSAPAQREGLNEVEREPYWLLGSLRPGEERMIQISGTLDGQVGDNRTIAVSAGSGFFEGDAASGLPKAEGTILTRAEHLLTVQKSFLDITLEAQGAALSEHVAHAGQTSEVKVLWKNNLSVPLNDATIAITLDGSALNKAGVSAGQGGFYRSVDSLLLWDVKTSGNNLQSIAPGASGEFVFQITPLPQSFLEQIRKPTLSFAVHAAAKRLSEQGVPEVLKSDSSIEIPVATNAAFSSYSLFKSSPFGTLGPLPPKVEYETTYAIVWEVANTTSDLKEAIVRAELPHYVRWIGLTTPASEQVRYDKTSNSIEWNLGTVKAGAGTQGRQPRVVSFALGLVPSATQIGQTPELIRNQTLEAVDTYSGDEIRITKDNVNTKTEREGGYQDEDARVVQ